MATPERWWRGKCGTVRVNIIKFIHIAPETGWLAVQSVWCGVTMMQMNVGNLHTFRGPTNWQIIVCMCVCLCSHSLSQWRRSENVRAAVWKVLNWQIN